MEEKKNYFSELNAVDVSGKAEKKGGLTYLSWPWAWGELKKRHPDAFYTIYENNEGLFYHHDGRTAWVKTGVTVDGIEHIEYLPIMDYKNQPIPLDKVRSTDVNKTIQRSVTKAVARHGLGLYIYAGEDLPEGAEAENAKPEKVDGYTVEVDAPAYPPRDEMIEAIKQKYPAGTKNEAALLAAMNASSIEEMYDAQLMAVYNKIAGKR